MMDTSEVRQHILDAAQKLNYAPNHLYIRMNKSYEVCVLSWSTDELHMLELLLEKVSERTGIKQLLRFFRDI